MPFVGEIALQKDYHRQIDGMLSFSSDLATGNKVELFGILTFSGALQRSTAFKRYLSGVLSISGDLTTAVSKISLFGALSKWLGAVSLKKNGVPVSVSKGVGVLIGKIKGVFFDKDIHI